MSKSHRILAAAITFTALCCNASNTLAEPSKPRDLKDYQCKDLMILSGEDREIAFALVHGYRLGKKNTTQFEAAVLAEATDNIMDYCLDHPADNALVTFEMFTK